MHKVIITAAITLAAASAHAQSLPQPPIPYPGQISYPSSSSSSNLNNPGPNWDHWGMQSLRAEDGKLRRVVAKNTSQVEWNRARRAAMAINANKCGEAAVIAAQANDARLMEGVKRACKAA